MLAHQKKIYGIPNDCTWISDQFAPHDYEEKAELLEDNPKAVLKSMNKTVFQGQAELPRGKYTAMVIRVENNEGCTDIGLSFPVDKSRPAWLQQQGQFSWDINSGTVFEDGSTARTYEKFGRSGTITLLCDTVRGILYFLEDGVLAGLAIQNEKLREGGLHLTVVSKSEKMSVTIVNPPPPDAPLPSPLFQQTSESIFRGLDIVPTASTKKFLAELDMMDLRERIRVSTAVQAVLANQRRVALLAASSQDTRPSDLKPSTLRLLYELNQQMQLPQPETPRLIDDNIIREYTLAEEGPALKRICQFSSLVIKDDVGEADKKLLSSFLYEHLMAPLRLEKDPISLDHLFIINLKKVLDKIKHLKSSETEELFGTAGRNLNELLPKLKQAFFNSKIVIDKAKEDILMKIDGDENYAGLLAEFRAFRENQ